MAIFDVISYQGLSFFPTQNFYCEKQNTRPKRKPMHDTLTLQWFGFWFGFFVLFFLSSEKRGSGRDVELIFIAIYLAIFCPLILVRKVNILAKNSVPRIYRI